MVECNGAEQEGGAIVAEGGCGPRRGRGGGVADVVVGGVDVWVSCTAVAEGASGRRVLLTAAAVGEAAEGGGGDDGGGEKQR